MEIDCGGEKVNVMHTMCWKREEKEVRNKEEGEIEGRREGRRNDGANIPNCKFGAAKKFLRAVRANIAAAIKR